MIRLPPGLAAPANARRLPVGLIAGVDLSVWIDCPLEIASERGRLRDRETYKVDHDALSHDVWTPNDRDYFARFRHDQEADLMYAPRVV